MYGADLPRPDLPKATLRLTGQVLNPSQEFQPLPWPARKLIVAAGKKGILPMSDDPDQARRLASVGTHGDTRAVNLRKHTPSVVLSGSRLVRRVCWSMARAGGATGRLCIAVLK